jgi:hypothetical protein
MGLGFEVSLLLLCKNTIDYVHTMLTTSLLALHFSVANKATIAIKNGGELIFTCTPSRNSSLANNRSIVYYWVLLPWAGFSLHQIDMHVNLVSMTLHEAKLELRVLRWNGEDNFIPRSLIYIYGFPFPRKLMHLRQQTTKQQHWFEINMNKMISTRPF